MIANGSSPEVILPASVQSLGMAPANSPYLLTRTRKLERNTRLSPGGISSSADVAWRTMLHHLGAANMKLNDMRIGTRLIVSSALVLTLGQGCGVAELVKYQG